MRHRWLRRPQGLRPHPRRGAAAPRVPRVRLGGPRRCTPDAASRSCARSASSRTSRRLSRRARSRARPASATRAGRRTAVRARPTRTRTSPGNVAVVHNGIIENHVALRRELEAQGRALRAATRTPRSSRTSSTRRSAPERRASSTPCAPRCGGSAARTPSPSSAPTAPDEIVVAKADSPLVIGLGEGEMLCASDIPALLAHTRDVVFLHDGEVATLTRGGRRDHDARRRARAARRRRRIDWSPTQAEKGGYKHFMLKEIHEQPRAVEDTLRGRVDLAEGDVVAEEIGIARRAREVDQARLLRRLRDERARGDGGALLGRAARAASRRPSRSGARCATASRSSVRDDLVVAVSQSGETLDTLAAVKTAQGRAARTSSPSRTSSTAPSRAPSDARALHARRARRLASRRRSASRRSSWRCSCSPSTSAAGAARSRRTRRGASSTRSRKVPQQMRDVLAKAEDVQVPREEVHARAATCSSSGAAPATPSRSRARSSSRRSRTSTPRGTRPAR